jgi:hypothetical protein
MTNKDLMDILKNVRANHIQRNALIAMGIVLLGTGTAAYFAKKAHLKSKIENEQLKSQIALMQANLDKQLRQVQSRLELQNKKNVNVNQLNNEVPKSDRAFTANTP